MPNNDAPKTTGGGREIAFDPHFKCVSCGNMFERSEREYFKLKNKNIPLPTRCPQCRKLNIIDLNVKYIIKLLTNPIKQVVPVKVTTEVTKIKVTKKDPKNEQELPKKPTEGIPSKA